MQWYCGDDSFHMALSKEVPKLIEENIQQCNQKLLQSIKSNQVFYAIHPGGPKIIEKIQ
jgi:predicted naringenin-chalcone synthase